MYIIYKVVQVIYRTVWTPVVAKCSTLAQNQAITNHHDRLAVAVHKDDSAVGYTNTLRVFKSCLVLPETWLLPLKETTNS